MLLGNNMMNPAKPRNERYSNITTATPSLTKTLQRKNTPKHTKTHTK